MRWTSLLPVLLSCAPALADAASPADRLSAATTPEEASALAREACEDAQAETATRFASRLGVARGPAAVAGARVLLRSRQDEVREAALAAVSGLQLRDEALRAAVTAVLDHAKPASLEHLLAIESLGWVGDGRDVERILDAADSAEPAVSASARMAFRMLTRAANSVSKVSSRRRAWSAGVRERGPAEVRTALNALEAPADRNRATHRDLLLRHGWLGVEDVRERLRGWLRTGTPDLRVEAARTAAELRLCDLTSDIESAVRFQPDPVVAQALREALARLGPPPAVAATRAGTASSD